MWVDGRWCYDVRVVLGEFAAFRFMTTKVTTCMFV